MISTSMSPYSQHSITIFTKLLGPPLIGIVSPHMLPTIHFDDQPAFDTAKIDDERPDGMLPPKFDTQPACTKLRPEPPLGVSRLAAKSTSNFSQTYRPHHLGNPHPCPLPYMGEGVGITPMRR